jgi:DNA-directed RNA polymerase II subunit RPB1
MNLTVPVKVFDLNLDEMQKLVNNSPNYPSANYAIINSDVPNKKPIRIDLNIAKKKPILRSGDMIERHLINGDVVLFNRQPTLHKMSMMSHKVRVMPYSTFRLNVNVCASYNADFDGDEMNLHVPQSMECEIELKELSMVSKLLVSSQSNKPVNSIVQDSMSSVRIFTKRDTFLNRDQVMNILMIFNLCILPVPCIIRPIPLWSGKQLVSLILPEINFLGFNSQHPDEVMDENSNETDTRVIIRYGTLISGILCKKTIGTSSGGIIHIMFNDHGPDKTRDFIDSLSQMLNEWMVNYGFSVGIGDALIKEETGNFIDTTIKDSYKEVNETIEKFNNGTLESKGTLSIDETKESIIQDILARTRDSCGKKVHEDSSGFNNIQQMVESGAKGSIMNITQISGCVGQQIVESKRIPYGFKDRTLPCYTKFDDSPESRGFVKNSFLRGLQPQEMFFHAMGGREGVIDSKSN